MFSSGALSRLADRCGVTYLHKYMDAHRQTVTLSEFPTLAGLCWFRRGARIPREDAYSIYTDNWSLVDQTALTVEERQLIHELNAEHGNLLRIYSPAPQAN